MSAWKQSARVMKHRSVIGVYRAISHRCMQSDQSLGVPCQHVLNWDPGSQRERYPRTSPDSISIARQREEAPSDIDQDERYLGHRCVSRRHRPHDVNNATSDQ
ncbi:hypothetical protein VNO80_01399 [Phaseolus coccineus]|uniref:Uncharacterized protein n=1 Tax=Phaseolus coccineus TaxID=3886 RepID=A0AAN9WWN9_PHACN